MLTDFLSEEGRVLMANYTQIDLSLWHSLLLPWETRLNGDALDLVGAIARRREDSVDLAIAYRPFRTFPDSCRVYVHVSQGGAFHNYDFDPLRPVPSWPVDSLIVLQRTIPYLGEHMKIMAGLFTPEGPLDGGLVATPKR